MPRGGNPLLVENGVATRIIVRPIGSGLPLGFFAFGIGMFMLAGQRIGWIRPYEIHDIGLILVAFVAPLEFLATVMAFLARDSIGAATLGLFSGSWFVTGWALLGAQPGQTNHAFGLFSLVFATVIALLAVMALAAKPFFSALLAGSLGLSISFGVWNFGGGDGWLTAAGWFGFALGLLAFYGGIALGLEDAQQREVLPLFRRGAAKEAIEGGLHEQLERLANEPGVRKQL